MQTAIALLALAGAVAALPQGVTSAISPEGAAPSQCQSSYDSEFGITVMNVSSSMKRGIQERQESGILTLTLEDGRLHDQAGRTGYIASNYQFQFDDPPQAGSIYTSGFSLCSNGSLALGDSAIFYQCLSGGFYNLYDRNWAEQCNAIYLMVAGGASTTAEATQMPDGQPAVTQIDDGQIQGPTGVPVSEMPDGQPIGPSSAPPVTQIPDGQPQAPTEETPVTQISDGQPQAPTGAPVTQLPDGQPQAATEHAPVTQISDGQPQAPASPEVTQISDGQPQAPAVPEVTQISDGQPQAPAGPEVTQISDGQPQVPTSPEVTQISDGQPQVPAGNVTVTSSAPETLFTGAAAPRVCQDGMLGAAIVGLIGAVALL